MLLKATVELGLGRSRVEKRIQVNSCNKCWSYVHSTSKCNSNIDRSKNCRKCNKEGHVFKDCSPVCAICEDAHILGSGKCQDFRTALRRAREEKIVKK